MGVRVRQKIKGKGNPWWVFVSHNGKRTSRKVGSKKGANDVAAKIEAKLKLGEFGFNRKKIPAFGNYSIKWLKGYVKLNCRESTVDEYRSILKNHILPIFKKNKLDQITRGSVRNFLLEKHSGGLSGKRVMLIKTVLSGIFNYALDEELIETNPALGISKRLFPRGSHKRKRVEKNDVFTNDELNCFLDTCKADFPDHFLFFFMAARTGMRLGELLALRWGDVDLRDQCVWVIRSYRIGRYARPKSGKARRVDLSKQLTDALSETLRRSPKETNELIFPLNGKIMEQSYLRKLYKRILKKAKVRYVKFHGIRHTYCAHLLSKSVSPYYVSRQVGHSSISITCDVYGSWISTEDNRHVDLLDTHPNTPLAHPGSDDNIEKHVKSIR